MVLPVVRARDFQYTYEWQTITYTVLDENAKTCKTKDGYYNSEFSYKAGNSVSDKLVLPSTPKDGDTEYTLTEIGAYSFCRSYLKYLKLPSTLVSIGEGAFYECYYLTGNLIIPNSVTTIGYRALGQCHDLTGELTIPNSVTSIGRSAFNGTNFTDITCKNPVVPTMGATIFPSSTIRVATGRRDAYLTALEVEGGV